MVRTRTPVLPTSGISSSALATTDNGGTRKPGEMPRTRPDRTARTVSTIQDGCERSGGSDATNSSASSDSVSASVPDSFEPSGESKL